MAVESDVDHFTRLITTLGPWMDQVVVIGGWAPHRLYRLHNLAQPLEYSPMTTLDTDVALPAKVLVEDRDIRDRLLAILVSRSQAFLKARCRPALTRS